MIEQKCEICGNTFKVSNYRIGISKYCSRECYHKATRKISKANCLNCGEEFIKYYENHPKKFCSFKCATEFRKKQPRKATICKTNGYKMVWFADGKGKKEHIYIIEQLLGRKLKKGECVHHIDGNRANNDISNLRLMTIGEHSSLHRKKEIEQGKKLFGRR